MPCNRKGRARSSEVETPDQPGDDPSSDELLLLHISYIILITETDVPSQHWRAEVGDCRGQVATAGENFYEDLAA